ncbi:MAG: TlpA family protein disulfide reductase [Nitrospirae bacterium]|nr:TlpA family protein disulfide reductase [Nitrospirota bacterium]
MHKQLGDRVEFIGVNVAINERPEAVRDYVGTNNLNFTNIYDKGAKITKSFGVMGTPTHIVIDRQGIIRYAGVDAPDDFEEHMKELLD